MKVLIDDRVNGSRKVVDAELIRDNGFTIVVQLADGNIISRKKSRDIPSAVQIGTDIHQKLDKGIPLVGALGGV